MTTIQYRLLQNKKMIEGSIELNTADSNSTWSDMLQKIAEEKGIDPKTYRIIFKQKVIDLKSKFEIDKIDSKNCIYVTPRVSPAAVITSPTAIDSGEDLAETKKQRKIIGSDKAAQKTSWKVSRRERSAGAKSISYGKTELDIEFSFHSDKEKTWEHAIYKIAEKTNTNPYCLTIFLDHIWEQDPKALIDYELLFKNESIDVVNSNLMKTKKQTNLRTISNIKKSTPVSSKQSIKQSSFYFNVNGYPLTVELDSEKEIIWEDVLKKLAQKDNVDPKSLRINIAGRQMEPEQKIDYEYISGLGTLYARTISKEDVKQTARPPETVTEKEHRDPYIPSSVKTPFETAKNDRKFSWEVRSIGQNLNPDNEGTKSIGIRSFVFQVPGTDTKISLHNDKEKTWADVIKQIAENTRTNASFLKIFVNNIEQDPKELIDYDFLYKHTMETVEVNPPISFFYVPNDDKSYTVQSIKLDTDKDKTWNDVFKKIADTLQVDLSSIIITIDKQSFNPKEDINYSLLKRKPFIQVLPYTNEKKLDAESSSPAKIKALQKIIKSLTEITAEYSDNLSAKDPKHEKKVLIVYYLLSVLAKGEKNDKTEADYKKTIEHFYAHLNKVEKSDNLTNMSNLKILEMNTNKSTKRFIAGLALITLTIVTGLIPGLIAMGVVYALTRKTPAYFFNDQGTHLKNEIDEVTELKNKTFKT